MDRFFHGYQLSICGHVVFQYAFNGASSETFDDRDVVTILAPGTTHSLSDNDFMLWSSHTSPSATQQQSPYTITMVHLDLSTVAVDQHPREVKQQFGDQPDVYNQFLDVMKEFKSQTIDTPGVIQRVSELFKGHPNLIFGFNTFLPPGYRIRPETLDLYTVSQPAPSGTLPPLSSSSTSSMSLLRPPPVSIPPSDAALASSNQPAAPPLSSKKQPSSKQAAIPSGAKGPQPVEFDHAILYVTTIKKRFADEPETYKAFLEILHTYQKEQGSIKQVLDQVSFLFRDHPDLLREFTFFLPDAVQEQAKERLNKAAEKAQLRQAKLLASTSSHPAKCDTVKKKSVKKELKKDLLKDAIDDKDLNQGSGRRSKQVQKERGRNKATYDGLVKQRKHKMDTPPQRRDLLATTQTLMDPSEWHMFEKIKKVLPSRDSWREFLKCLELYAQEIVGRDDLIAMVQNLLGRHSDVVAEFTALLHTHGQAKDDSGGEIWPFIPLAETDLSQCRRATPSYRALPASYPLPPCSFRSPMERHVCNDAWVSVPTGSEDFSFKSMRKNQYEEALFKCEDERYDRDMVNYAFETRHQMLELLAKHPAGAIPVIFKRLQQKDDEWRRARQDLNKQWKDVNEKNYHKSLDHSSFYFKQKDKKALSAKHLLSEAKKTLDAKDSAIFTLPAAKIHKDAFGLLTYAAEKIAGDKDKISKIWTQFFFPFFQLDESWLKRKPVRSTVSVAASKSKSLVPGTEVVSDFGEGVVKAVDTNRGIATVQLPVGIAYIHVESLTIQEAADFPPNVVVSDDRDSGFFSEAAYVFVRLYHVLYSRLEQARELCEKAKRNRNRRTINPAAAMLAHAHHVAEVDTQTGDYEAFMSKLYALIDQLSLAACRYEDCCRSLMGSSSYFLFTMDKLVTLLLKQMQHMATDDACQKLAALYQSQLESPLEKGAYFTAAKPIFDDEGEGAFWMEFASGVLRKTPLASPSNNPGVDKKATTQLWAPSPRTKHTEPSKWLVEPHLSVEYLGSVEDDSNKDDDATLSEEDESGLSEEDVKSSKKRPRDEPQDDSSPPPPPPPEDTDESAPKRKKE
ncbi:hypothetical protein DYB31_008636 [Aphanomyces astaci]|uniref:Histone deacetylase interacting domain-containing protein n=1 Tax=Aphanomyces astaci TaxID=112090 RepID=A0A397F447_APHAT|nr:hypothetical protein DYB31_008636 [Aphanomyces astaci]